MFRVFFIIVFSFFCFFNVKAQDKAEPDLGHGVDASCRSFGLSSLKSRAGNVEILESALEYSYNFKVHDELPVQFSLAKLYVDLEDNSDLDLPPCLTGLISDVEITLPFFGFQKTHLRLGFSPSFYSGEWHFSEASFRIPSRYFVIYRPDDKWDFIAGLAVHPNFETKTFPIFGFIYKPNDKIEFYLVPERPNISYFLNPSLKLFIEGSILLNEFTVNKGGYKSAVLGYKRSYMAAGVGADINKYTQINLACGEAFGRCVEYRDSLGKLSFKNTLYTEIRLKISI